LPERTARTRQAAGKPHRDVRADADEATIARARGWAFLEALVLISIGRNGRLGLPGRRATWEPADWAALERALGGIA
jgi:hypothetical protein